MSDATNPGSGAIYELEPKNKYFEAIRAVAEYEIRPGNTVTFLSEVDLTEVERVRAVATGGRRPSYTAFVVKAVALALREFPYANRRVCRRPAWIGPRRIPNRNCLGRCRAWIISPHSSRPTTIRS